MEIKVNHHKVFSPSGCVYQRGFKIDRKTYVRFMRFLDENNHTYFNKEESFWLKQPLETCEYENSLYFMNLTQTEFFIEWVFKREDLEINKKRARLKANGYMEVMD